jgi:Flp pilus assembly protein TadG
MLEAALVVTLLIGVMVGIFQFGWLFGAFVSLSNAAAAGATTFANCGGFTAASGTPCASPLTAATNAAEAAAGFLTAGSLTVTASVSSTSCTTNSSCSTALQTAPPNTLTAVSVGYPCSGLLLIPQSVLASLYLSAASGQPWSFCPTYTMTSTQYIP